MVITYINLTFTLLYYNACHKSEKYINAVYCAEFSSIHSIPNYKHGWITAALNNIFSLFQRNPYIKMTSNISLLIQSQHYRMMFA